MLPKKNILNSFNFLDYPNEQLVEVSWQEVDNSQLQRRYVTQMLTSTTNIFLQTFLSKNQSTINIGRATSRRTTHRC